jgi:hypothetical protein
MPELTPSPPAKANPSTFRHVEFGRITGMLPVIMSLLIAGIKTNIHGFEPWLAESPREIALVPGK